MKADKIQDSLPRRYYCYKCGMIEDDYIRTEDKQTGHLGSICLACGEIDSVIQLSIDAIYDAIKGDNLAEESLNLLLEAWK